MKRLLLVDDDEVLTRFYRDRLSAHGFQVNTAASGASALSILRGAKPDLVVLDLLMPELSGVDLLRFIRSVPKLASTPVVVLTNTYLNDFGRQAATLGIQKAFRKAECSPSMLMAAIDEILEPQLAAARQPEPDPEPATSLDAPPAEDAGTATPDETAPAGTEEPGLEGGASLLDDAQAIRADLAQLFEAFAGEPGTGPERQDRLQDLFCKVHFLSSAAGQSGFPLLAETIAVLDALLYVLMENPDRLGPSMLRTVGGLVEVVGLLFQDARESGVRPALSARVLVVANDPEANEKVMAALRQAQLDACSTEDSLAAWQWINSEHYDLVLLNAEMPILSGAELGKRLRLVPGYEKIPVIFVTAHDDFDSQSTSTLSGADDLIVQPVLPQELAARVVLHLVRAQMQV